MPVFDTPKPIFATLELSVGHTTVTAGDRADTVVEVRPTDETNDRDVKFAKQTRIEYSNGALLVKTPNPIGLFTKHGSVDVTIELPAGSGIQGRIAVGEFRSTGDLGDTRITTAMGHILIDSATEPHLKTAGGDITMHRAVGTTQITTSTGGIRVTEIDGSAVIKNSNGTTEIGLVTGNVTVNAANGDIAVGSAQADVDLKSANGSVRVGEVIRGSTELRTALGTLEIGIRAGTAAKLDVSTAAGRVHNALTPSDGPSSSDETVEVRARTSFGDIVIRRS
ncbi:DUF4097 family beta strand repeat protein [Solihabitans fulvus]|uniref:DUF4097 family beta strand repeat protein n=1 Tax=Solihabitans fulvus TaxID=1892852 RepID=A0A5B2WNM5_9PSEU|nr:DUF4097 family beta strand repeat-containing protein [Solihabitans fulvus]KAA2253593.1 DUF4097 family beta strand repeat protein [Solihabitans fulvus]